LLPTGSEGFQKAWEEIYNERTPTEPLSHAMERCILACGGVGISVPKPFYDAKHQAEGRLPELTDPDEGRRELANMEKLANRPKISEKNMR
jgi:hypothetical protein